jgi:hypothetical protein
MGELKALVVTPHLGCVNLYRRTAWGVQKGRRWPQAALPAGGTPLKQDVKGSGMAGAGETLGSPWPPLAILSADNPMGQFHDQGDAKWIVIRGQLRSHNDMPFGRPTFFGYRVPKGLMSYNILMGESVAYVRLSVRTYVPLLRVPP